LIVPLRDLGFYFSGDSNLKGLSALKRAGLIGEILELTKFHDDYDLYIFSGTLPRSTIEGYICCIFSSLKRSVLRDVRGGCLF
jgi:hypothetical protein